MTHPEPHGCEPFAELLGVYALDALDPDEGAQVAGHVQSCPRCAHEVGEHREAVALVAAEGGQAPEGVWERIAGSIAGDVGSSTTRPAPRVTSVARRRRRPSPVWAVALSAAAALAVVVGLQTARVDQLNQRVDELTSAARQSGGFHGLAAALVDPSARHYTLTSIATRQPVGQLIVLASGASYLVGSRFPQLTPDRTYQLWSMVRGRAVSVGLLGARPGTVAFTIDPSVLTAAYLVTVEPAGGVVAPTGAPVAQAAT